MNVLVDTPIWSVALRRAKRVDDSTTRELTELVKEGRVMMMGAVRQELLSGIKSGAQFGLVRDHLREFPDTVLESADYEKAAEFFNACRARGIQGSNTDLLICAATARRHWAIFTTDGDFRHYARHLPIRLHARRS